ncbi:hypothetical protein MTO96_030320 [Rhipicephalus appendiculatus]
MSLNGCSNNSLLTSIICKARKHYECHRFFYSDDHPQPAHKKQTKCACRTTLRVTNIAGTASVRARRIIEAPPMLACNGCTQFQIDRIPKRASLIKRNVFKVVLSNISCCSEMCHSGSLGSSRRVTEALL